METTAFHFHCTEQLGALLPLNAGDGERRSIRDMPTRPTAWSTLAERAQPAPSLSAFRRVRHVADRRRQRAVALLAL